MESRQSGLSPRDRPNEPGRKTEDEVFEDYAERINQGEPFDRDELRKRYPEFAERLIVELELYEGIEGEPRLEEPLGTLGDYTLRRQIGRGGMGVVYEAWQNSLDRQVALKVLPVGAAADTKSYSRFLREAQIAAKLSHPHVVAVHGFGVEQNTPYFAMEFVEGETLARVLARIKEAKPETETPFGPKDQVDYFVRLARAFADVADGLQHAHSKGIIHRDIKPSNLILDREGRLRILDFGLARLEGQESLTISGEVVGTPLYMSPEQARRKKIPVDHRTDVYSLGATLYEMLALQPPFRGKYHEDTLSQIIERDPVEPRNINPRVPKDLETIVLKCLRKDAGGRYGTAEALGQDLRRFVRGEVIEARPQPHWEKFGRMAWRGKARITALLLLSLFLVAAARLYWNDRQEAMASHKTRARAAVMRLQTGLFLFGQANVDAASIQPFGVEAVEDAVKELQAVAAVLPRNPAVRYHLSNGLLFLVRDEDARKEIEEALRIDKGFVPAKGLRASILERRGDLKAAEVEFTPARVNSKLDWGTIWLGARRSLEERRWREGAAAYGKLIELERAEGELYLGSSIELMLGRGLMRLEAKDYLRAIEDFSKGEALWPDSVEPTLLKAKAYYLMGDKDSAEEVLQSLRTRPDYHDDVVRLVSILYSFLNDPEKARQWAETAPEAAWREIQIAVSLQNLGRWEESERAARKAVALEPGTASIQAAAGWIFHHHERFKEARELYERAIELNPRSLSANIGLGWLLENVGETSEAMRWCRKAVALHPRSVMACIALGRAFSQGGNLEDAVGMFEKAQNLCPRSNTVFHHWGAILYNHGLHEEALVKTAEGLELCPTNSHGYADLGDELLALGRTDEAIQTYRKALDVTPGFSRVFPLLGSALERAGRAGEACDVYSEGIELHPGELETPKRLLRLLHREAKTLRGRPSLGRTSLAIAEEISRGNENPILVVTLALTEALSSAREDMETFLEAALRGIEKAEKSGGPLPLLAAALNDLLALLKEERSPDQHRLLIAPHLPPCAVINSSLDAEPVVDWRTAEKILDRFSPGSREGDGDAQARFLYLEGRLLNLAGKHHEVERAFQKAIEHRKVDDMILWGPWAAVSLGALKRTPGEVLERFPQTKLGRNGDDLRWLLESLEENRVIRINCGGEEYEGQNGKSWARDRFFTAGDSAGPFEIEVSNTEEGPLYQTERVFREVDGTPAGYRVPLPEGRYRVTLHFAEAWWHARGLCRFDVLIQGETVLPGYEPFAVGFARADDHAFCVVVEDGSLNVEFLPRVGQPKVSGIEVERLQ